MRDRTWFLRDDSDNDDDDENDDNNNNEEEMREEEGREAHLYFMRLRRMENLLLQRTTAVIWLLYLRK